MKARVLAPVTFVTGLAAGAAAGLLFAPHKGKITRAKIKQAVDENKERAEEAAINTRDKVTETARKLKRSK